MTRIPSVDDLLEAALDNDGTSTGMKKVAVAFTRNLSDADSMEKVAAELEEWAGISQVEEKEEDAKRIQEWKDFRQQRMYKLAMVQTMLATAEAIELPAAKVE